MDKRQRPFGRGQDARLVQASASSAVPRGRLVAVMALVRNVMVVGRVDDDWLESEQQDSQPIVFKQVT